MEEGTFETLIPSRYISFTLPINSLSLPTNYFSTNHIHISVLDSPLHPTKPLKIGAILVPKHLQNDWIFTTQSGHFQLLLNPPGLSRLILINDGTNGDVIVGDLCKKRSKICTFEMGCLEKCLYPLLMALLPKECVEKGDLEVPFLSFDDNVVCRVVLEVCSGDFVGEMLVEDVEIEGDCREFRRRLRFKRMPYLIQTEIRVLPNGGDDVELDGLCVGEGEFWPDLRVLVHPYLEPMVAGLSLISGYVEECFEYGVKPRGLCVGVGGGALLSFMSLRLGFEVVGVEMDEVVLRIAKQYFGLRCSDGIKVCVGDGIEILKRLASLESCSESSSLIGDKAGFEFFEDEFLVVMVDLDSYDSTVGISAPAFEFVQKDVLLAAKSCLSEHGLLVLNVIPPSRSFYDMLMHELQEVFVELYEIDCGNEENFVLIASMTSVDHNIGGSENSFRKKLKSVLSGAYVDSIKKI